MLSPTEIHRYKRHLSLPGFGTENQEKLKAASVLVIGAGGLGSPVLLYLAAAGVGTIGIADHDKVDISNLQRQIIYTVEDVGKFKAAAAAARMAQLNPHTIVNAISEKLTKENAYNLIAAYDIVVDGTDNFSTRYMINDACVLLGKPCVSGSVFRYEGQVTVLNALQNNGNRGPDYRQLFPYSSTKTNGIDCNSAGVLGVLPGIVGTLQATEVIKLITNSGEILSGELLLINALNLQMLKLKISSAESEEPKPHNRSEFETWNYDSDTCTLNETISAAELMQLIDNKTSPLIVDVRMPMEFPEAVGLESINIPLPLIAQEIRKLEDAHTIILFCKSGQRSKKALEIVKNHIPTKRAYSLEGGIEEWNLVFESNLIKQQ